jgi:hypothetical protein
MKEYRKNRLVQIGFWLLVIGAGPLSGIILLAEIGLWPDPNPNPIGPGLLFFFTFWPAAICLAIGVFQVRRKQRS